MKKLAQNNPTFTEGPRALIRDLEALRNRFGEKINDLVTGGTVSSSAAWDTGKTWHTGDAIQAVYVDLGTLPNATSKTVAHGVSSFTAVLGLRGMANDGTDWYPLPNVEVSLAADGTNITVDASANYSTYTGWAILEYY